MASAGLRGVPAVEGMPYVGAAWLRRLPAATPAGNTLSRAEVKRTG
jgi:hypothetical protein